MILPVDSVPGRAGLGAAVIDAAVVPSGVDQQSRLHVRSEASFTKEQEACWAGVGSPPGAQRQWSRLAAGTSSRCPRLLAPGPTHAVLLCRKESLNTQVESDPRIYTELGWGN